MSWSSSFEQYSSDLGLSIVFEDEVGYYSGQGIYLFKESGGFREGYSVVEHSFGSCSHCDELRGADSEEERKAIIYTYLEERVPLDKWIQDIDSDETFLFASSGAQQSLVRFLKEHNLWTL
jgi:hypothetical protein